MSKHTPGPWHRNIRAGGKYPVVFAGRNQHVATVSQQANGDETEANIDLIAAAPDLLDALKPFVLANSSEEFVTLVVRSSDITKARAAIAKVTGAA